jgi:VWFA-related protein
VLIVNKCLLLLLPVVIAAQTTPAPPEPVLRSTTRLIQLNVIVHDKHGQPVRDLKKEDFTVLDNGKPQAVSIFSMDSNAVLPQVAKLAPNVFTNQLHQRSAVPSSVTVILLDELNTNYEDKQWAKQQVVKFLGTIHPEDRVAIYVLGRGLRVLHDFTTDSSDLLRKLSKYNGGILPEGVSASDNSFGPDSGGQFDGWMNGTGGVSGAEADFYTINRVEGTLHAIDFIANHLASLPGRKNLIWVSGGFPLQIGFESIEAMTDPSRQQRSFGPEVERTINALNEGNVAIYPVDSRGLVAPMQFSAANRRIDNTPKLSMGPIVEHQQTMSMLADRTGGHAYYNTNDLAKAIRDAVDDSALTYTIGFYPEGGAHDGKFHKLQVKTTVAGTNVRYRKGYFDTEEKPQDVKARRVELRDAVWSPIDASAMGLLVQVAPPDPAHPTDLNVYVRVDPAAIGLTANGNLQDGALDFLFIQKNEQGKQFNGSDDTVTLTLKPESAQKLRKEGLIYHKLVAKLPQATQLRVVVRDASSGTLGSVTVPFSQLKL